MNTLTWYVVALTEEHAIDMARHIDPCRAHSAFVTDDEDEIGGILAKARKRNDKYTPFRVTIAMAASVIPDSCLK